MAEIIQLENVFKESTDNFLDLLNNNKISHAVICWRHTDGHLGWSAYGMENKTYLIGMLERIKRRLLKAADEQQGWDWVE